MKPVKKHPFGLNRKNGRIRCLKVFFSLWASNFIVFILASGLNPSPKPWLRLALSSAVCAAVEGAAVLFSAKRRAAETAPGDTRGPTGSRILFFVGCWVVLMLFLILFGGEPAASVVWYRTRSAEFVIRSIGGSFLLALCLTALRRAAVWDSKTEK